MPMYLRIPVVMTIAVVTALTGAAGAAQAADNLLHGPHPFANENELSAHVLLAHGSGDAPSGTKMTLDYGFKLTGGDIPLWLNLALNYQRDACTRMVNASACSVGDADVFETLAGVRWQFATPIPLVPFAGASAGLVYAFPTGASSAAGVALRAVGGANYFFFDWLGLGAQVGYSLGSISYDSTFTGSHRYAIIDVGGGIVFQF
jgi:hypothetical protein